MIKPKSKQQPFGFYQIHTLRYILGFLGVVLIASGTLKLSEFILMDQQDDIGTLLYGVMSEAEVLAGLWLIWGAYPERTRPWAIAAFTGFWVYSLSKVLTGSCSCGCFGALSMNPWVVLLFDTIVVVVLLKWRCLGEPSVELFSNNLEIFGIPATSLLIITAGVLYHPLVTIEGTATRHGQPLGETKLALRGNFVEREIPTDQQGRFQLPPVPPGQYSLSFRGTSALPGSKSTTVELSPLKERAEKSRRQIQAAANKTGSKKSKRPTSELLKEYADIELVPLEIDECSEPRITIEFK